MPKIRHLDNLVDELAKGKPMEKILERDHQRRVRFPDSRLSIQSAVLQAS